ncbi:hypothetical protein C8R43DRAFT_1140337 [Mycena crocata]|nr:hypothetical protein C8R43DRAFT_1140337 [Mycena crocata]
MSNIFEFYGICSCMAILTLFFLSTHFRCVSPSRSTFHRTPAAIHSLLDPPTTSTDTLLRSRASANFRLLDAFHLTNTFVNPDSTTHSEFHRKSINLMQAVEKNWNRFAGVATQAVELFLPDSSTEFHTFVRAVTLSTIIVGLLDPDTDIPACGATDVNIVANLISDIWVLSKKPDPIPEHLRAMLNTRLRRLIPDQDAYPNPLDFVIPTWDPMWRLVAATIAEIHQDAAACRAFQILHFNPYLSQFREPTLTLGRSFQSPSVQDYLNESLRLHPPVKHIARHIFRTSRPTSFLPGFLVARDRIDIEVRVADIENVQRAALWGVGSHPDVYDAGRFLRRPELAQNMLAFGYGPLKCTGMRWAPMAAAIIAGAILNRVDGGGYQVVSGSHIGTREGWDGWMVRKVDTAT